LTVMAGAPSHAHAARAATVGVVGTSDRGLATSSTVLDATTGQACGRTVGEHCILAASGAIGVIRGANLGTFSLTLKIDFTSYNGFTACGTVETGSQVVVTKLSLDAATLNVDTGGAVCVQPQNPGSPLRSHRTLRTTMGQATFLSSLATACRVRAALRSKCSALTR